MATHDDSNDGGTPGPALPVVAPVGELDIDNLGPLRAELRAVPDRSGVVLDASGIVFADSSFLNVLISTHQRTDLRIAAPSDSLLRLLTLTGIGSVLTVYSTVEEAQRDRRAA